MKIFFRLVFLSFFLLGSALVSSETYGAIEIGGKGVKAYAITVDDTIAKISYREAKNIAPQSGILSDGHMNQGMIELISTNVLVLKQSLMNNQHIPDEKIFVVASSAINKIHNKNELTSSIQKSSQTTLYFIDEKEESVFGFYGVVPKKQWENAAMMDIGGGNTKIAWFSKEANAINFFEIPLGTVSLSKAADAQNEAASFEEKCESIASNITISNQNLRSFDTIETLYLSGGIFWATAFLKTDRKIETFEPLEKNDFTHLRKELIGEEKNISCDERDTRCFLKSSYGIKNIIAGSILSEKIIDKLGFSTKKIMFAKDGTWIIGWILFHHYPEATQKLAS